MGVFRGLDEQSMLVAPFNTYTHHHHSTFWFPDEMDLIWKFERTEWSFCSSAMQRVDHLVLIWFRIFVIYHNDLQRRRLQLTHYFASRELAKRLDSEKSMVEFWIWLKTSELSYSTPGYIAVF